MKALAIVAVMAAGLALTGCMGIRGRHGSTPVCENETFLGISIIEIFSPCTK